MVQSAIRAFGWKAHAETAPGNTKRRGQAAWCVIVVLSCIVLLSLAILDGSVLSAMLNRFTAIHLAVGAIITTGVLYAAVTVFAGLAGIVLAITEAMPRLALAGTMMGVLPFAQASDPVPAKPEQGAAAGTAQSEIQVGLYGGRSSSPDSDVHFTSPDDTDMTLTNVKWSSDSFKPSPFYGGRGIDWNARAPRLGVMVDFTHAKATAIRSQTVTHHGKHKGVEVPASGPITDIFRKLEFTHGLNYLTLNGVFRATGLNRRIVPYAGLGIGFMVPHVNVRRAGQAKEDEFHEAQVTGMAAQVFGGIEWRVFKSDRRSVFTEYKLTLAPNLVTLKDGGSVTANIRVHQFIFGGYYTPWRAGDAAAR